MSRKLATLRTISAINPIPGADAIEVATVDGWQCVVKKGEYSVGQTVIYFEIDSVLPKGRPEFEFLMARSCKMQPVEDGTLLEGHRLRTIKLRGQVSQGLVIPLRDRDQLLYDPVSKTNSALFSVPEDPATTDYDIPVIGDFWSRRTMDDDLSDIFGVKKYERPTPAQLAGMSRGNYPGWLPKTDQERVQNIRPLPHGPFYIEEKMEGSSMTVYHDGEEVGVTSRNIDLKLDQEGNTFVDVAFKSDVITALYHYVDRYPTTGVAVRGELIGPGIQDNIYNLPEPKFHIFDVWLDGRYLTPEERQDWLEEHLAPFVNQDVVQCARLLGTIDPSEYTVAEIVEMANGKSDYGNTLREGLVFKSCCLNDYGRVESFKAISPEYLLKEK